MIVQLLRYGISSLGGLIFNLLLLSALVEIADVGEIPAAVVSAGIALLLTFALNQGWVFSQYQAKSKQVLAKRASFYYIIMIGGKSANIVIYSVLLKLNIWYPLAWVIGSGIVFGVTFLLNRNIWTRTAD
ncbi:GtrA family protein [Natronomonas halophila]|uniref:GtrA family protein n=1 Tax=Natronomonas halophila TaxID=2747817 RepID=UPI0015B6FD0F|nr:GtrA family protein [Natronomonas halophila]QLD84795.1 GtrA family protein [Natronomonas halophila]